MMNSVQQLVDDDHEHCPAGEDDDEHCPTVQNDDQHCLEVGGS